MQKKINIPRVFLMAETFPCQMAKFFQICKWIFFPISTFVIIDEIAFELQKNDFVVKFGALSFFMIIS